MSTPYFDDGQTQLWLGDCREILPGLDIAPDAAVCDPPYVATSLAWDRWPTGWTQAVAAVTSSMWCFGSLRMFMTRGHEVVGGDWRLSHEVVWEKHTGSGFGVADRFRCMHELVSHWYRGRWDGIYHRAPRVPSQRPNRGRAVLQREKAAHRNDLASRGWEDDDTRLLGTVIYAPSMRGHAIHPTEKPVAVLTPLIEYAVPPGGLVLDPMAGSCSTAVAARLTGRRAVCIEAHELYAETAARRLDQGVLPEGLAAP